MWPAFNWVAGGLKKVYNGWTRSRGFPALVSKPLWLLAFLLRGAGFAAPRALALFLGSLLMAQPRSHVYIPNEPDFELEDSPWGLGLRLPISEPSAGTRLAGTFGNKFFISQPDPAMSHTVCSVRSARSIPGEHRPRIVG